MNAAFLPPPQPPGSSKLVFWTALTVGAIFFAAEHDWQASKRETFAPTADEMESSAAAGSLGRRLAFPFLAAWGLICIGCRPKVNVSWRGVLPWILAAYLLVCAASLLWSDDPSLTGRRLIVLGCFALGAMCLGTRLELPEICRLVWLVSASYVALGVAIELLLQTFRPWQSDYRFAGSAHPNTQVMYCALAFLSSLAVRTPFAWRGMPGLVALSAGGLIILTGSRTGCAGLLAAVAAYGLIQCSWRTNARLALIVVMAAPVILLLVLMADVDLFRNVEQLALLGREDHAESLTGRIPLWDELSWYVRARPLLGYGYNSFWDPDHIYAVSSTLKWGINDSHNAYLESTLSVGLVGTGLLLLAVLLAVRRARLHYRATRLPGYAFLFAVFVLGFVNAFLESGMTLLRFVPFVAALGMVRLALREAAEGNG